MTQEEALSILKAGVNVFLTGEPGSGKTHTINAYVKYLRERGVEPAITASTGIAATHIGGYTVHSWSGIGIKREVDDYDIEMILSKEKTARRIIDAKVLIIDEISMLDASTLSSVDRVLRAIRRKPLQEEEPFGGLQVIFVGDFFQLPPVSRENRSTFAFNSFSWKEANPVVCYLSEQHRQEDDKLLGILSSMRDGTFEEMHWELLKERIGLQPTGAVTRLYTHNADVDRINQEELSQLEAEAKVFHMQTQGARSLVETLKASCLSPEALTLKIGAAVMFTRNNFEVGYVNGTLGVIESFDQSALPVVKTRDGRLITVEQAEWSLQDGNKVLARITQVPLRLAWAITVHKSQGMSWMPRSST
jgi:ATP-dependent DNA helicase PIF1